MNGHSLKNELMVINSNKINEWPLIQKNEFMTINSNKNELIAINSKKKNEWSLIQNK